MEIKNTFKTKEGFVTFEGTLSQEEADFVIGYGLNGLMEKGATFLNDSLPEGDGLAVEDDLGQACAEVNTKGMN